ncbi:VOC family protein [Spirosoma spitsbergense]|uniref:VOC family protein n=1 Tax=Spirosoma spitsbergense TaxID=431554 RepID=UPI000371C519|nr:VOC family protein [Spirosoma spitsbergense]
MEEQESKTTDSNTLTKVTGIGGIFFFSDNPEETRAWYAKNLGFDINAWGSAGFESRDVDRPDEVHAMQWSPFKTGDAYFAPSSKAFMINYRVQHLEALVDKLRENGATILDDITPYDYGKLVHIMNPDGNKIELWEP